MADENGRLIAGRYRLGRLLGQGGMGFVWQAHDQVLDRQVAVKEVFVPGHDEDRDKRAFREARAAARLNHPGIVTIHDLVSAEGRSWIVMELVPAPSLDGVLRESGPLPAERVARIGLAMLDALRAAHRAGILHRDIKPANVLLPGDRAVITDFGIATIAGDDKLTATGQVIGTPAYMPPERLRGEPATEASDMWALGATLYAAVTGHPPGAGAVTGTGPLAPVLQGLLRDDPRTRLTAGQASALIESPLTIDAATVDAPARTGSAGQPTLPGRQPQPPAGRRRPRPTPLLVGAVGLAAVAATAIVLAVTLSSNPPANRGPTVFTPSPGHTASAKVTPSTAASSASSSVPRGYSLFTDHPHHFSAAIPDSWVASPEGQGRRFCAPGGCPEVIYVQQLTAGSDPIVDIRNTSAGNGSFPASDYSDYHRLRLGPVSYFAQAAEAEFTLHKRGTPGELHGRARVFTITSGGKEYFVQMTALSTTWDRSQPVFNAFFATFRPAN